MSDVGEERPHGWLYRSMVPGRPATAKRARVDIAWLWAPGRAALEMAVILSAFAILVPVLAAPAIAFALRARSRGHTRWLAVAGAALWCGLLGIVVRTGLGLGIVP
jgi:hypothetical protein